MNVYDRTRLRAGNQVRGPAIVVQMDATTVIHPNHTGEVDAYLSILIRPDKASLGRLWRSERNEAISTP